MNFNTSPSRKQSFRDLLSLLDRFQRLHVLFERVLLVLEIGRIPNLCGFSNDLLILFITFLSRCLCIVMLIIADV